MSNQSAVEPTPGSGVQVYTGEAKEVAEKKAADSAAHTALENDDIAEDDAAGAVLVDDAGLDRVRLE